VQSPWDRQTATMLTAWVHGGPDFFYGEPRLYRGDLIRCQNDHDNYVCSREGVAMSGGDETCFSTQVSIVRCA
jgi:hypothetical protein